MYKSKACRVFFTFILMTASLSVEAVEAVASLTDGPTLQIAGAHTVTARDPHATGNTGRSSAGGHTLDIAFVISNAILGFLLLRRANRT